MPDVKLIDGLLFREGLSGQELVLRNEDFDNGILRDFVIRYLANSGLKSIEINDSYLKGDIDLAFLKEMPWVEQIRILKLQVTGYDKLVYVPGLKSFTNNFTSDAIDFSVFKKLENANIIWSDKRKSIFKCNNLKTLVLYKFNKKDLTLFSDLSALEYLQLIDSSISELTGIGKLSSIRTFELSGNSKIEDLSQLEECKELKRIVLEELSKVENVNFLSKFEHLEFLKISECRRIVNNQGLFNLKNLKVLAYTKSGVFNSIKGLEKMQSLERFIISDTDIKDGDLMPLLTLKNLKYCSFKDKNYYFLTLSEIKTRLGLS